LTRKVYGPSYGRLPEGQSLRAIYHDPIQPQSSEDQAEVNQVQRLLAETTPPPLMDENQWDYDGDLGQLPSNEDADMASDYHGDSGQLPSNDADVASDVFPPPTPLAHTSLSGEEVSEQHSALAGATAQGQIPAEGEIAVEGTGKPPHRRGRPAGARNKPKGKPDTAKRQVQKRARSLSSDSDNFDITTPIVVRIHPKDPANPPPPPKKTRRTRATAATTSTVEERREHIQRQRERSVIIRNFSADLKSFLDHLNNQGGVSAVFDLLKYKFSKNLLLQSAADDERYEKWLSGLKDALENTDVNKSMLKKNNVGSVFCAFLTRRSYCTLPENDAHDGFPKDQGPQPKRFPDRPIHRGNFEI